MKKRSWLILTCLACSVFFLSQCSDNKTGENSTQKDTVLGVGKSNGGYESQQKWGEHLVRSMSCGDCHTPKKMGAMGPEDDSSLLLSGHPAKMPAPDVDRKAMETKGLVVTQTLTAWVGPWGISYAANLTSDTTGIGMWSEDQFLFSIRNGKLKGLPGSRSLLPPMPWRSFSNLTDDELKAIFAYLKSTKPVVNLVPQPAEPVLQRKM
jgi:mono/diheme cytochrome c family protein